MKRAGVITILAALLTVLSLGDQADAARRCRARRVRHHHCCRVHVQCCTTTVSCCDPCAAVCDPCGACGGTIAPAVESESAPAPAPAPTEEVPPPPEASAANPAEAKLPAYL